jgi:DNA-directed DNA polymerase III PolC
MILNAHTFFSLRYGTLSPEKLVDVLADAGHSCIALTDINNTSCAYAFIKACERRHVKPVLGIEFRQGYRFLYAGIARSREGWRQLCALLSRHSIAGEELPAVAPQMSDVWIVYRQPPVALRDLQAHEFVGIRPDEANRLQRGGTGHALFRDFPHKLLVWHSVTFPDQEGYRLHKLLRCIDLNIVIGKLRDSDCAHHTELPLSPEAIRQAFAAHPYVVDNTMRLLESCTVSMPASLANNRRAFTGDRKGDLELLHKLAFNGCRRRYGTGHSRAEERVRKELAVIERMDFCAYFLITWDIVRYAHSVGYFHVGRGSGANSIVAYCLGITDVDPLELDLYFERFINPHRSSPPDFDIDFSWDERDDVTDYIFKRYGMEYTALLATYNTFKGKSIIRELGKVLGLPKADIDCIVDEPHATDKHHPYARHIFRFGKLMEGFPNYLSIHAGGILISEEPIHYFTAQQMMPKGFPIVHFDMYGAEDLGFHKYDVLSQRGLGHIREAVELVSRNQGKVVNVHDIGRIKQDAGVQARLRSGQCIGCFYIESPAMRGLLSKLRCDNYVHLVAASSIIRPGVAQSGMMREYIQRFHKPDSIRYLHPVFERHLGETFGVMVYQEDVMKIVHHFAGLDLDESDVLRRIMTGKKKSSDTFRQLRDKYFANCRERGYSEALIQEVWRQIESFSGYSFCKAHSASFAVESFQSLYLKTYFPLEFMVAVINNFGGFYDTELYVHEARMSGGVIHPPCVNHSHFLTGIENRDIYIGFVHIQRLEQRLAQAIVRERATGGPFNSLSDFLRRVDIGTEQLMLLIRIGAFRFTGMTKCSLMWEAGALHESAQAHVHQCHLFEEEAADYTLPQLADGLYDQAFDEIELLGFSLCSPFSLLSARPAGTLLPARDMVSKAGRQVRMLGYYVTRKHVTTVKRELMAFGTWIDESGHFFDSVHFPDAFSRFPFRGKGCYLLQGRITLDFGFPSLEVISMEKLPYVKDDRY